MISEPKHMNSTEMVSDRRRPDGERQAASVTVGEEAEKPAAQRAHQEGRGEQHGRIELLDDRIIGREEGRREIQREGGVGIEVVPFDQIAHGADEDRLDAFLGIVEVKFAVRRRCERFSH
jgi:hypothetical protein